MHRFRKVYFPYIQGYCDVCTHYCKGLPEQPAVCTANQHNPKTLDGVIVCRKIEYCTDYRFMSNVKTRRA